MVDTIELPDFYTGKGWDILILGDSFIPGIAYVECESGGGIEIKKQTGTKGGYTNDAGVQPASVTITIRIFDKFQLAEWGRIANNIRPAYGKNRKALDILHPTAQVHGVKSIIVDKMKTSNPDSKKGWIITLSCKEYVKKAKVWKPPNRLSSVSPGKPRIEPPYEFEEPATDTEDAWNGVGYGQPAGPVNVLKI